MNFTQHKINGCDCWTCGDFKIDKLKNGNVYYAYKLNYRKVMKPFLDDDGKKTGKMIPTGKMKPVKGSYSSIYKVVTRTELMSVIDPMTGFEETDENDETVMEPVDVLGPKEYATLEQAKAVCV